MAHGKPSVTPIAPALRRFFNQHNGEEHFALARLWEQWDTLFGPDISALVSPLGHSKDTLILGAEDAIVIQEFSAFSDQFLQKVNGFLGKPRFNNVHIQLFQGRSPLNKRLVPTTFSRKAPVPPNNLGRPGTLPDDHSPVTQAYTSYVQLFQQAEPKDIQP